jgi:hypothetical protein
MATRDRSHTAERNGKPAARAAELPMPQNDRDAKPSPADGDRANASPIHGAEARLAARMSESQAVPTATSFREVDVATLAMERTRLNEALAPRKLSYTHLLAFAVAQAVAVHPRMAAFYREIDGRPHRVEPTRIRTRPRGRRRTARWVSPPGRAGHRRRRRSELVTLRSVFVARAIPWATASSKLLGDVALISVTRATVIVASLLLDGSQARYRRRSPTPPSSRRPS